MLQPSPEIRRLLTRLHEVRAQMYPENPADGPDGQALSRLVEREASITRRLADEPVLVPDDRQAKLDVLCLRLRERLDTENYAAVITYMLAESTRGGAVPS